MTMGTPANRQAAPPPAHHEKLQHHATATARSGWTGRETPLCSGSMKALRVIYARLLAFCLALAIVAGSLGMGSTPATAGDTAHHETTVAAGEMAHATGCPSELVGDTTTDMGHGACAMTVCCFSELPDWRTQRIATVEPARFDRLEQGIVPRADPEKADKPPRQS